MAVSVLNQYKLVPVAAVVARIKNKINKGEKGHINDLLELWHHKIRSHYSIVRLEDRLRYIPEQALRDIRLEVLAEAKGNGYNGLGRSIATLLL